MQHYFLVKRAFSYYLSLMSWIYLIIAGILEIGWPLGMKLSTTAEGTSGHTARMITALSFSVVCMAASGFFLWLASKSIPIGTAYAIWTGVGAVGTFFIGIIFFNDSANPLRFLSAFLLVAGIIGLKLTSTAH